MLELNESVNHLTKNSRKKTRDKMSTKTADI